MPPAALPYGYASFRRSTIALFSTISTSAMSVHDLAGQPAPASALVDVSGLLKSYQAERPDPSVRAERVSLGTSGHRGASLDRTFNEAHILAITQAICEYRAQAEIDGPLFLAMDTHALSLPAHATALEVLAAHGVDVTSRRRRWLHADARRLARHPNVQRRPVDGPGPTAS